jgi:hypothetical protein
MFRSSATRPSGSDADLQTVNEVLPQKKVVRQPLAALELSERDANLPLLILDFYFAFTR